MQDLLRMVGGVSKLPAYASNTFMRVSSLPSYLGVMRLLGIFGPCVRGTVTYACNTSLGMTGEALLGICIIYYLKIQFFAAKSSLILTPLSSAENHHVRKHSNVIALLLDRKDRS
jgi:hypothetical protein